MKRKVNRYKASEEYLKWGIALTPEQSLELLEHCYEFFMKIKPLKMNKKIWEEFKSNWSWPEKWASSK